MKPITKIIIFLIVAFIIIFIIVAVVPDGTTTAPVTASPTPVASASPAATMSATVVPAEFTLAQVAMHKVATDCWTVVNGNVYNLTPFVNKHPGGVANITKICGVDGTSQFMAQHGDDRDPQKELATLKIGTLKK